MKQQLADLIEAFAAARTTNNRILLEFSSGQLSAFLQRVEIVEPKEEPPKEE
jgi:hypothetical protein